jgi:threonine dehydrogenase-like Zn-dependent dehydrogenase
MENSNSGVREAAVHIHTPSCSCWQLVGANTFAQGAIHHPHEKLPATWVRIRMLVNGHCESDTNVARKGKHPSQKEAGSHVLLGHEPVGLVEEIGSGVTHLKVGQMVAVEPGISCGECLECKAGRYNLCRNVLYMATPAEGWSYGSYARTIIWPAHMCHVVPSGLTPMVAALAESMAAGAQALDLLERSTPFCVEEECVILTGFGQMGANILLQALKRWPALKVIVMARKEKDRELAMELGAYATVPLVSEKWNTSASIETVLAAAEDLCADPAEAAHAFRIAEAYNAGLHQQNVLAFKRAREIAHGAVACVLECTGSSQILNAALEARIIRGDGSYGLVSCLYSVGFDMALLRRDSGTIWTLRRSRFQFPKVLKALAQDPEYYERLIGHVVEFDNVPDLYKGDKGKQIGNGPKIMITY